MYSRVFNSYYYDREIGKSESIAHDASASVLEERICRRAVEGPSAAGKGFQAALTALAAVFAAICIPPIVWESSISLASSLVSADSMAANWASNMSALA